MMRFLFAATIASLVLGSACKDKAPAGNAGLEVSDQGATRTVRNGAGDVVATGHKGGTNARFPPHAPAYPGGKVLTSVDMDVGGGRKMHNIVQRSEAPAAQAVTFYQQALAASGKPVRENASATGTLLSIGDSIANPDVMVTVTALPDGLTEITIATITNTP